LRLNRLESITRKISINDDCTTPVNHPIHATKTVLESPVKHRIEEAYDHEEEEDCVQEEQEEDEELRRNQEMFENVHSFNNEE
jgi:hypothetical protein